MQWTGSLTGMASPLTRKFLIGDDVNQYQLACWAGLAGNGILGDPASVNDYSEAIGVTQESGDYSTTQGSGGQLVECTYDPLGVITGHVSGGTAADTDWTDATDGNLMKNTSASSGGTVLTDADVGTSEFVGGYLLGLTGNNANQARVIDSHSDNTSETVDDPFDKAIAVNDTFLRTFAEGLQGIELTTNFRQFMGDGVGGVDLPDTGHAAVIEVYCEQQQIYTEKGENPFVNVINKTNPRIDIDVVLIDHMFNSIA